MITIETHPYAYGSILSRSLSQAPKPERPGIGRFLSQGAAAGAFICFLGLLSIVLSQPQNGYNIFVIFILPFLLAGGMIFGLFEGLVIWGVSRLTRGRLNTAVRTGIGIALLIIVTGAWWLVYLFYPLSLRNPDPIFRDYVYGGLWVSLMMGCPLAAGSKLQPWREFVRGAQAVPSRWLTGITGLVLRVVIVFMLMESILALICILQRESPQRDFVFTGVTFAHFLAATVIVFARVKFWLLLPLALIVNIPIGFAIIKEFAQVTDPLLFYVPICYLAVWAAFLLTRWSPTYSALSFFKEELRYYLID
jgi:hypothetical protein